STATSPSGGVSRSTAAGRDRGFSGRDSGGRRAKPPAGAGGTGQEGVGAGGRLTAAYERAMGAILPRTIEQNKNIIAGRPHASGRPIGGGSFSAHVAWR